LQDRARYAAATFTVLAIALGGAMGEEFNGFPRDFFAFFRELRANNDRVWFEANQERFRESVQAPMSAFIAAIAEPLARISKQFVADPRPHGGSMFRIYRDVRFSKDKRPYKEHGACQFRHRLGRDVHAPGFYVHLAPGEVFFGGGMWMPESEALFKIRSAIASNPERWKKVVNAKNFRATFGSIEGEQLTRPPRGFDPAHPLIDDIRRKSFVVGIDATEAAARSRAFRDDVKACFTAAAPLMGFLCSALNVPF
jgi:uncharacterized protein (TIGR02453 family)